MMLSVENLKIDTISEMIFEETEGTINVMVESDPLDEDLRRLMNLDINQNYFDVYLVIDVLSGLPLRWEIVGRDTLSDKEDKLTILITDAKEKIELYLKLKEQGGKEYSKLLKQSRIQMTENTSILEKHMANNMLEGLIDFYTERMPFRLTSIKKDIEEKKDEIKSYIIQKIVNDLVTSGHPLYENGRKHKLEAFYTWASVINSGVDERDFITMLVEEESYGFAEISKYLGANVSKHFMEVYEGN